MIGEAPPDPPLEDLSDNLTKNSVMLVKTQQAFLGFAEFFANSPSLSNYKTFKKANDIASLAFKNYAFSIADLEKVDDATKQALISELFFEDQTIRVTMFNHLTESEDFENRTPSELYVEENEEAEKEAEEAQVESEFTTEEWITQIINYQKEYAESDFAELRKKVINKRIGPKTTRIIDFGVGIKDPVGEVAKKATGTAIGTVAGILIARSLVHRSNKK
jgi:hypothetical protein